MRTTGRFFNHNSPTYTPEGYVLKSVREELAYHGFEVYFGWKMVPAGLVSASRAKKEKLIIEDEPAAYCEDAFHWITALYRVKEE